MAGRAKRYRVLNPNDMPEGVPVMHFCEECDVPCAHPGRAFYEGDVFTPVPFMKLERLLAGGFIEAVKNG